MTQLQISSDLSLPLEVITEAVAVLAARGAGKSNAAVVMAEEMYDHGLPWVAIDPKGDWHGIRSAGDGSAPGLSVVVFGGLHGDVPLEPTAGRLVADLIVDTRLTCVLDVSEMTKADQRRFLLDFAERLYRRNTEPLHVFCEEADEYIPQMVRGEAAKLVGAFETLVKRGRFRGLGVTLITQRSASLNKDVLTQVETLIAMRTPSPQDRKAVLAWVDVHDAGRDLVDQLPTLESGEAWVFSPHALKVVKRIRFRRRRTFDSGATPKIGGKPRPPARLADVDLAAIKEAMAETIERAKADDPKELRKRIAELERQLRERPTETAAVTQEVRVVPGELIAVVSKARRALLESADRLVATSADLEAAEQRANSMNNDANQLQRTSAPQKTTTQTPVIDRPTGHSTRRSAQSTSAPRGPASQVRPAGDGTLGKGERVILTAVAQYPDGVTREQLTVLTGYKRSSRDTYLQRLQTAGLVERGGHGLQVTDAGIDALGDDFEPLPTGVALQEHWLHTLTGGEQALLSVLIQAYPSAMSRDALSEETGYKRSSRDTYLQRLRSRQLITTDGGNPRAADVLFESA